MVQQSETGRIIDREPTPLKIADLFPGQGFVSVELIKTAKNLLNSQRALEIFKLTDEVLGDIFPYGYTFTGVINNGTDREIEQLTETEFAQPAVLTVSMASVAAFEELGGNYATQLPDAVSGHSGGIIGALWRAEAISAPDAIILSRRRGEAMSIARIGREAGAMAAVSGRNPIDQDELSKICSDADVELVNINSPLQVIISGEQNKIALARNMISLATNLRVLPLNTSDAFHHSQLMRPAVEIFDEAIIDTVFKDPIVPVYFNSTGQPLTSSGEIIATLADEIVKPVNWVGIINNMRSAGIQAFREFGHGNVLTGLVRRINPEVKLANIGSIESARQASFQ